MLACCSGALLVVCFPPFNLSALAWIALVPLLLAIDGKSLAKAYCFFFVAGFISISGIFSWMWTLDSYTLLDYVLMQSILANYLGLWGAGLIWARRTTGLPAVLVGPPLWVALEVLRSHVSFLSLPYMLLSHSQYQHPSLIQIASVTGAYGVSFLIVLVNCAIAHAILAGRLRLASAFASGYPSGRALMPLGTAVLLVLLSFLYGREVVSEGIQGKSIRLGVIQGNIPQVQKWDGRSQAFILGRYSGMTRRAAEDVADVIVWPETAIPKDIVHTKPILEQLSALARETQTPLLVGSAANVKFDRGRSGIMISPEYYNSMVLISAEGTLAGQYKKMVLVPFGEYTPLREHMKWPSVIFANPPSYDFLPGKDYTLFKVDGTNLAAPICWETIFPDLVREFVRRGAQIIVNPTNDAMFKQTAVSYQYLAMDVFRAVENRVPVVRVANTGVSAFVDPFGRITTRLRDEQGTELFVAGMLVEDVVVPTTGPTFYTRHGDIFAFLIIAISCTFFLIGAIPKVVVGKNRALETHGPSHVSSPRIR